MGKEQGRWSIPVGIADVPPEGRRYSLNADEEVRGEVARQIGVIDVPRLDLQFEVGRAAGDGLCVNGTISATVTQTCVVTLEPVSSDLEETVDLVFLPDGGPATASVEEHVGLEEADPPEVLPAHGIDLAAIAIEFLQLGLDPYPRKPDADFAPPEESGESDQGGPFAALEALRKSNT